MCLTRLATAYATAGEPEQACAVIADLIAIADGLADSGQQMVRLRRYVGSVLFYGPVRLIREILQPNDHFLLFGGELGEFKLVNQQVDGIQDPVELIAVTANLA